MLAVALCYGASSDLTDAQINAAIERAARRNGDKVFSSIVKQYVRIGNWHVLYVLSPSDRIAVAAYRAEQQGRPFTVQDARAMGLGMVAVCLEPAKLSIKGVVYKYRVALQIDDKIIQPVPGVLESYSFTYPIAPGSGPSSTGAPTPAFMFPAVEGTHRLTVILTREDGQTKEKKADPKRFGLR